MQIEGQTGSEALLRALRAMGVETIFASPGSDWAPLWEALARPYAEGEIPEYVSVRHEETAVAMASGYWKTTGKLPAVVIHTTVGGLHATMAVRAALHERIPMVVLAGESVAFGEPPEAPMGPQWLRLLTDVGGPARLMEPCVKWSFGLNTPTILPHTIERACQLAKSAPLGPVFVSVPAEFLMARMQGTLPRASALPRPPAAQPQAIEEIAQALAAAKQPLFITEEAGRNLAAVEHLVALAERLGARVVEAWHADYANFPPEHPLYGGIVPDVEATLDGVDLVVLVDCVVPWHPATRLPKDPSTRVMAIGEDPLQQKLPYWGFRTDLVAPGDTATTLAAIGARVAELVPAGSRAERVKQWGEVHAKQRAAFRESAKAAGAKGTIDTKWVGHELAAVLPSDAIVMNETISHRLDLLPSLALSPGRYFETSYGGLGMGTGMALGVKHARRDRVVTLVIGDGSFHYNPVVAALGAAQEHDLPFLVVLFDNGGYRSQKGDVVREYPDGHAVRRGIYVGTSIAPRPDYTLLAQAYGGTGERVTKPGEVRAALERAVKSVQGGKLALVHVLLDPINPSDHR